TLGRIEAEETLAIAVPHGAGRYHFGVKEAPPRQQTVKEPAMPVGPVHHRGDTEPMVEFRLHSLRDRTKAFSSIQYQFALPQPQERTQDPGNIFMTIGAFRPDRV